MLWNQRIYDRNILPCHSCKVHPASKQHAVYEKLDLLLLLFLVHKYHKLFKIKRINMSIDQVQSLLMVQHFTNHHQKSKTPKPQNSNRVTDSKKSRNLLKLQLVHWVVTLHQLSVSPLFNRMNRDENIDQWFWVSFTALFCVLLHKILSAWMSDEWFSFSIAMGSDGSNLLSVAVNDEWWYR